MNSTERFAEFSGLVDSAYKSLRRAQGKYTRSFGLRSMHVACMLRLLDAGRGLSATELSELCGVDRAQISRVVGELTAARLLREAEPGEKRRYRGCLELTDAGRAQAEAMSAIVAEKLDSVAETLPPDDVETFYRVFREITALLEDISR